jgi:general secretion pathway protein E/type IV pilus assembly protein PilB
VTDISEAIARCLDQPAHLIEPLVPLPVVAGSNGEDSSGLEPALVSTQDRAADAPILKMVHDIILGAVHQRTSDIHREPLERRFRIRYRIDGVLTEAGGPAKRHQPAIISRLKIMANISIGEKRMPQDGRVQLALAGRTLDFRVSSLPTIHGESIVMRILDQTQLKLGLPELGIDAGDQVRLEKLIASPDGMVLVTGPTGSGKTTTLYSCLHHLNQTDRKIIIVEDPVEYQLTGVHQVPVRPEIGMILCNGPAGQPGAASGPADLPALQARLPTRSARTAGAGPGPDLHFRGGIRPWRRLFRLPWHRLSRPARNF